MQSAVSWAKRSEPQRIHPGTPRGASQAQATCVLIQTQTMLHTLGKLGDVAASNAQALLANGAFLRQRFQQPDFLTRV